MKKALVTIAGALLSGAFFIPVVASADVVNQLVQTDKVFIVQGTGSFLWRLGTTTASTTINSIAVVVGATSSAQTLLLRITWFADTFSSSQSGCTDALAHASPDAPTVFGDKTYVLFRFPTSSLVIPAGKVPLVELSGSGVGTDLYAWGFPFGTFQYANQCKYPNPAGTEYCKSTPYFQLNSSIDWGALNLYTPVVFSSTTQGLATSTINWGALSTSSIPICTDSTNFFSEGLCVAASFLFVPNPDILNQYVQLPNMVSTKFPFSWFFGMKDTINNLSAASSSVNFFDIRLNFQDMNVASTSPLSLPQIAPNVSVLSTSTIQTYISEGTWNTFQTFIKWGIWLSFISYVFFEVRNKMHKHV